MEAKDVDGIPAEYDAGINRGLGVPAAFYHFAFEAGSEAALAERRDQLRARGVEITDIVDHGWAKSIYFRDPNGLSLEYCCMTRDLRAEDLTGHHSFRVPRATLELERETSEAITEAKRHPVRAVRRVARGM